MSTAVQQEEFLPGAQGIKERGVNDIGKGIGTRSFCVVARANPMSLKQGRLSRCLNLNVTEGGARHQDQGRQMTLSKNGNMQKTMSLDHRSGGS